MDNLLLVDFNIATAMKSGINYIGTAPVYGDSQKVLGYALEEINGPYIISTKLGGKPLPFNPQDKDDLRRSFSESLKFLSRFKKGHSLAIVGTGPASQSMVMWAKILNVAPVVVFGRQPKWSDRFSKLGADAYVTGDKLPTEVIRIMKKGGVDRVIEAVGSNNALFRCLQIVKEDGKVNIYSMPADDTPYDSILESDPRIFKSKVAESEVHDKLLAYIEKGKANLEDWVSYIYNMDEYQKAFEVVRKEKPTKVIIKM